MRCGACGTIPCTRPGWRAVGRSLARCWIVLWGPAQAGLTPFARDPAHEGVARFLQDVYIPEHFLEPDDGRCSSIGGPACTSLHGAPSGPYPGGIFSLFGSL